MFSSTLMSCLMVCVLILALCSFTTTAPTHHLSIGVQGNTPTLIVTSSEIGITPETVATNMKTSKAEFLTKQQKEKHKFLIKTKVNKNQSQFIKKEKLQYMTKSAAKHTLPMAATQEVKKSTSSTEEQQRYKNPVVYRPVSTSASKQSKINVDKITAQPIAIHDTTSVTITSKEDLDIETTAKSANQQLKKIKDIPILATTLQTKNDVDTTQRLKEVDKSSTLTTTLPSKEDGDTKTLLKMTNQDLHAIEEILTPTTTTLSLTKKVDNNTVFEVSTPLPTKIQNLSTVTTTQLPKEYVQFTQPKANSIKSTVTTTPSPRNGEYPTTTMELSTASGLKEYDDISTTINYEDTLNTATTSKALKSLSTAIPTTTTNDIVSTTAKQMIEETTAVINENDRNTENSTILRNENLLLTTTQTMTKTFTSPPILGTLKATNNAMATTTMPLLSMSLTTMRTTSANDEDNNEQQTTAETSETTTNENEADNEDISAETDEAQRSHVNNNKKNVTYKEKQKCVSATPTVKQPLPTAIIYSQTRDETMTTDNSLPALTIETIQNFKTNSVNNEQSVIETETETPLTTITPPFTKNAQEQPPPKTTVLSMDSSEITPKFRDIDEITTTETVLKLIDLEKHVVATIKQPTSPLDSHDNGHDGLKIIKKKQLIDKHYAEALLHNKQDDTHKSYNPKQEYLKATETPSAITSTLTTSIETVSSPLATATTKTLLVPIKHGFLGPILMEEKTFRVIHHTAGNNNNVVPNKVQHLSSLETQLRNGHFVELKAKTEMEPTTKTTISTSSNNGIHNIQETLTVTNKTSDIVLSHIVKSSTIQKEELSTNQSHGSLTASIEVGPENNLQKSATVLHNSIKSLNFKTSVKQNSTIDSLESSNINAFQKSPTILNSTVKSATDFEMFGPPKEISTGTSVETPTIEEPQKSATVLSTTLFQVIDSVATRTPIVQANTMFTSEDRKQRGKSEKQERELPDGKEKTESKISDIQIEVYDSTIDSIVGATNFKDNDNNTSYSQSIIDEASQGKTTKPPVSSITQERFTQYVIDRTETSTPESINFSTIQVASGKPEPAAIEIHINVSESFGNESEDLEFSYPQAEYNNNNERVGEESYDDSKVNDNIKLKIPSNGGSNFPNKDPRSDEILVVEIIDTDNKTDQANQKKSKTSDDLFISDNTPPPPPPPPPYQSNFDRDSDTIFYISNTEVKVGESIPTAKNSYEEKKLKLESQFFPANYMASTHPNINTYEDSNSPHHLYEEDIILSSHRNQADSLKIYRNRNEPSPPLDVTYVGESIIEVEQSPDSTIITTTYAPDKQHIATQQADVIIQPAILPEISIGVPVIGELPPQIELKEIDFMPNEAQLHRSGIYEENDNSNNIFNNDIDDNTMNAGSMGYSQDADINSNNQRLDESSIQYGGDLIDESADGGFDGVEGSYPFGNPAAAAAASSSMTKTRKQQPNHVADYTHLYVNYGVNNMRKDELSADVKDSGELFALGVGGAGNSASVNSNEQNITSFKEFLNKVSMNNSSFINGNLTQTERMSNATAFSVMEDANDLEEKNTEDIVNLISLAIGLFIVILPVVVTCSMFWALRYLYKKYHSNVMDSSSYSDQTDTKGQMNEDGVEKGEFIHELPSSSPTNSDKDVIQKFPDTSNKPSTTDSIIKFSTEKSTHLDQTTSSNKNPTTSSAPKMKDSLQLSLVLHPTQIHTVHEVEVEIPGPNGSITKMTLENNLLIVETEERNDISRVARETKMDYNKDGVFVVEVARGIDSKTIPESPVAESSEKMLSMFDTKHNNGILGYKVSNEKNCLSNEKVQIHSPPPENATEEGPRSLHQIEEVEEPINSPHFNGEDDEDVIAGLAYKSNIGLSQSDLSTTSSNDSNKGYCYGNQALYVVEQSGYSTMSPTGNVVLKCDSKDIKDEDHNPENDHYLEHSPDKKEDQKDKKDVLESVKNQENTGNTVGRENSPHQKQNDKEKVNEAIAKEDIEISNKPKSKEEVILNGNCENNIKADLCHNKENSLLLDPSPIVLEEDTLKMESSTPFEPPILVELLTPKELLTSDKSLLPEEAVVESSLPLQVPLPAETTLPIEPIPADHPLPIESVISVKKNIANQETILAVPEKFSDHCTSENGINSENHIEKDIQFLENPLNNNNNNNIKSKISSDISITENGIITEHIPEKEHSISLNGIICENGTMDTVKISLQINGIPENEIDKAATNGEKDSKIENKSNAVKDDNLESDDLNVEAMNGIAKSSPIEAEPLTNGLDTLPDLIMESKSSSLQNGEINFEPPSNSTTDMENGYDSIISLPEPPPTTEEQLNNDLCDQQLDSLPPPPPPETFNLKDLPPPLTNGDTDSLHSEESNNFYNTLPPPPPTTLDVTATNGKMHASPLTPPASPPAHFTNNLHAGLRAQPIAVDVNGS